jgi:hypothetical protein
VRSASDGELFPLVLEGFPVHGIESLFAPLKLVVAILCEFRPVVVVYDCFVVLLVYDRVPVAEICESIFQGWLLFCHKCRVIGLVFEDAGVGSVDRRLVCGVVILDQLTFHVVNVIVVVDGLEYLPVAVQPPPWVVGVCLE